MGARRRPEILCRPRLRAAARSRREARTRRAHEDQNAVSRRAHDFGFRMGTGAFALVLVLIVCAIAWELTRQSWESIAKFGFAFWRTDVWDPVAGQFGALPFIWGTLYSSVLALLVAAPISLGIAVFISELCPTWLRQ